MLRNHWGFTQPPFPAQVGARQLFCSPTHVEALARLNYLVDGRHRLGLLLGEEGVGKTLLGQALAAERRTRTVSAQFSAAGADVRELLWQIVAQWQLSPPLDATTFWLRRRLDDALIEHHYQRLGGLVWIDDATQALAEVREELVRLASKVLPADAGLTIVLASDYQGLSRFDRRLFELVHLRVELTAWDEATVIEFVEHALKIAGRAEPAFDSDALERLAELSQGVPRRVAKLAELSLVAAAASDASLVDAATVEQVYEELLGHDLPLSSH